jgi:hypothetical protein
MATIGRGAKALSYPKGKGNSSSNGNSNGNSNDSSRFLHYGGRVRRLRSK